MKIRALLLAATVLHAAPAWAVIDPPAASQQDPRMRTIVYSPTNPVQIYAAPGASLRIQLGADERVVSIVVSDQGTILPDEDTPAPGAVNGAFGATTPSAKTPASCDANLCRTVAGNFVYLKPLRELSPQPLFIQTERTTDAGKTEMVPYTFEVLTRAGDLTARTPHTAWGITFTYPDRDKAAQIAAWRARQAVRDAAERERAAMAPPPPTVMPATANRKYGYRGAASVMPDSAWDDGRTTFLRFNGNRRIPNVYRRLPDGKKAIPAYAIEPDATGNTLRIALTDAKWWIEDGAEVGCIFNIGTDPEGRTAATIAGAAQ